MSESLPVRPTASGREQHHSSPNGLYVPVFYLFLFKNKKASLKLTCWRWRTHQEKCRISPFSIDLRFKVARGLFVFSKWISVQQTHETSLPGNNCHATPPSIKPLSNFPTLSAPLVPPFRLSQLQLLHSSVRVWEGAPDCRRVRIAQDVTAEPASADQCRSLWQREPGWLLPQPQQQQQQLHQHQERDTVRLAMATLSHVSLPVRISKYLCFYLFVSVWA